MVRAGLGLGLSALLPAASAMAGALRLEAPEEEIWGLPALLICGVAAQAAGLWRRWRWAWLAGVLALVTASLLERDPTLFVGQMLVAAALRPRFAGRTGRSPTDNAAPAQWR